MAKLDRVMVNQEFIRKYPTAKVFILARSTSDHCPLHLKISTSIQFYGPRPFFSDACGLHMHSLETWLQKVRRKLQNSMAS